MAEFAYNNSPHSSTGVTPFFANYGYHPRADYAGPHLPHESTTGQQYGVDLSNLHSTLKDNMKLAQEHQAEYANRKRLPAPSFNKGDKVWLKATNIRSLRPTKKLDAKYFGPFTILDKVSDLAYRLSLPHTMQGIHNVFHINLLEPYKPNTIPKRNQEPAPPQVIQGQEWYVVDKILDAKRNDRLREPMRYLIQWEGYGPEHNSWEPPSNLTNLAKELRQWHRKHPNKPSP
jgi:hypothetical protein